MIFNEILQRPSEIQAVFVSDLHLSADTQILNAAFIQLLKKLENLQANTQLFILGDWLDAWIGDDDYLRLSDDDKRTHWLTPILSALQRLTKHGVQVFVMRGNRDFALSNQLCKSFGGVLIGEPFFIDTHFGKLRLEHGDALCTDDKAYQRYRRIIQNPLIKAILLTLPLSFRRKLAGNIQSQSRSQKKHKTAKIMDVNSDAVDAAFGSCDLMLHGHTHRPAVHWLNNKQRIVLGDWHCATNTPNSQSQAVVSAHIGVLTTKGIELVKFLAD